MFAIAFDLVVAEVLTHHPAGAVSTAYADIKNTLRRFDFDWVQGSLYVTETEDLANLFNAMQALRTLPWFGLCVRDIRAFRVDQWSDFTPTFHPPTSKAVPIQKNRTRKTRQAP